MKPIKVMLIKRPVKRGGKVVHYWNSKWPTANGHRYKSHGRCDEVSAVKARSLHREFSHELNTGKVKKNKPKRITLGQLLEMDRESIKQQVKPSTLIAHKSVSNQAEAAIGADTDIQLIDWQHVATLKNWLGTEHVLNNKKIKPCSKATIRKSIVTLKAVWSRAVKRELVDSNPFTDEKLVKVQSKQKRIYSHIEVDAMASAANGIWWEAFVRLAFTSGLRLGEIYNATWVDIDDGQITVSAKRHGKFTVGGKSYPVLEFSCKSQRERRVPLHTEAAKLLQRLKAKSGGSIYPFISLQRLAILDATVNVTEEMESNKIINNTLRNFKALQGRAHALLASQQGKQLNEIEWRIGCLHDFRKSFGTHMAKCVSMPELQKLMGHASITTTAEFYVDASDDVSEKLQAVFA